MSIAIALLASDGIIIASDSQITIGDSKIDAGKWRALFTSDPYQEPDGQWRVRDRGSCIVAGAGQPDGYVYSAAESIISTFAENKTRIGDELKTAFERTLSDFHAMHVVPYLPLAAHERPGVDLLIAYGRNNTTGAWFNDYSVLTHVSFFRAVGIAKAQATTMLETLYRVPLLDTAASALLASLVVYRIKSSNIYCGNSTDIMCILGDGFLWVERKQNEQWESLWKQYGRTIEAANFRGLLGAPLEDETNKAKDLRNEFEKVTGQFRKRIKKFN